MAPTILRNPLRGEVQPPVPGGDPLELHRRLPGYAPTPLRQAPTLAEILELGEVWVKDESSRMGLPAFKILGASWAVYRALSERLGEDPEPWETVGELAERFAPLRPLTLVTATDGNHGRAVARMARLLDLPSRIYVPAGTVPARMAAIASEGADVEVVLGSYDDAVRRAAEQASREVAVVPDTALHGFEPEPRWVIEGYATIFREIEEQAPGTFDLVTVQMGVGALAAAVVHHLRPRGARIVGVEPDQAACVLASVVAGEIVSLPGHQGSIMAGLNCGTPSPVAWPAVSGGLDLLVAVEDERAREAMRALAAEGITSGETGAAGLAGLLEALTGPGATGTRGHLRVDEGSRALVLSTEGATDPDAYRAIVG